MIGRVTLADGTQLWRVSWLTSRGPLVEHFFRYPHTARHYAAWRQTNPDAPHSAWIRSIISNG